MEPVTMIGVIIGVAVIIALRIFFSVSKWVIWNSLCGAAILFICNTIGIFTIKINLLHALIVGVFGIPGIIALLILT